ncbi:MULTISPECIES: hypothetical protein [unclassified Massilia]|uniref:hypothetical protein n=1 Tax=unclassified Massilia TaxID=2609279 RepID=UPI00177AC158|nr:MULTISPECIES: hypothetical protein [unclassified Massilia]MBD8529045.1 hypothetical protein [Massilia sp. CFBP 13647]MBD8672439.1 hypothetical protein [Massilia sp. CFBP 13721]
MRFLLNEIGVSPDGRGPYGPVSLPATCSQEYMQEPCQRFQHEEMHNPSMERGEFNHKIRSKPEISNRAALLIICTIVVQSSMSAPF